MKGYMFTGHHEIGDIEKSDEKFRIFPSAAEALHRPDGDELWLVSPKGFNTRCPYTMEAESHKVKFLKCIGDKGDNIPAIANMIDSDVRRFWSEYKTAEEAINNADEKRFRKNRKAAQRANTVFHAAIASRKAAGCMTIKDLASVVSHAISAWEAVCLDKRDEAVERYSRWIKEVSR
jgi:hypothetical protein